MRSFLKTKFHLNLNLTFRRKLNTISKFKLVLGLNHNHFKFHKMFSNR